MVASLQIQPGWWEEICQATGEDQRLHQWVDEKGQPVNIGFEYKDGILRMNGRIYIPNNEELRQRILDEAHRSKYIVHPGANKMYKDLRTTRKKDSIWVVVDRLTNSAHFIPVRTGQGAEELSWIYVREIVRLHGTPIERVNQVLEDMLRACVLEFGGSWDEYLPLVEFSYNNSYQSSIGMAPYEALYGRQFRLPSCWLEVGERQLARIEMVQQASEKIDVARRCMKIAQDCQKYYADHRTWDLEFQERD
ncbi:uncharacterized protein LOC127811078 [Diospyros lotus]|uniref:uncharacterized protein LOC127811078 n=1 Tax=Diospyros lotus TaxID=55363 RepID=UPI002253C694|nr:uncharacterized protein LOC127811078 [Diospyros lotus]